MFLDKILRWTNSSQFIDEYSRILFDEFVHTNNAQVAFNKAMEYAEQNKMSYNEIYKGNEMVAEKIDRYIASIHHYSDDDVGEMTKLIENLSLKEDKKQQLFKASLNKYLLFMAENGTLYEFDKSDMPISIQYKSEEKLYYFSGAAYVKKRRKTVGVGFSGPSASIRICKGVRYRIGSMSVHRETVESYDTSDQGIFYITNFRIGYIGKTQFSFDLKKLISIQSGEAGILIFKQGRENPFMIALDNYDTPCTILSCLLNQ